jgi:exopolysaccharide biosynthesis polyprenyl glycosylphosphotransferase
MKRILFILIDIAIIYGSILFTFYTLESNKMLIDFQKNIEAFQIVYPFIGIMYLIFMYAFGLYNISRKTLTDVIYTVFLISISLIIGIMGICFFVRDIALAFPRSVILISGGIYFLLLTLKNLIYWYISRQLRSVKKIMIIGNGAEKLRHIIINNYSRFYEVISMYSEYDNDFVSKIKLIDEVFICADVQSYMREKILPLCIKYNKEISFVPQYFDLSIISSSLYKTGDVPTFRITNLELSPEERLLKRSIDLLFGMLAAIVSLPVALLLMCLIKLDGGSIFYMQERLTRGNKLFRIYKFRTMIPDAEKVSGPVLAEDKDPRITPLGRFMRAIRLDEIPQLINVIKGEMSLVGPRPERPFFADQFEKEIPEYRFRLKVKAGLTGLAQVEGKYNTSVEDKLRYDLIYINNYSILRDLIIMIQTIKILFLKESTEGITSNNCNYECN